MPERILTQEEIDALMEAIKSGKLKPKAIHRKIAPYDFKQEVIGTPKAFSQAQREFSRHLSNYFVSHLRLPLTVEVANINTMPLTDYIESRDVPSYIAVLRLEPLQGQMFFNMRPIIAGMIVDVLCGGTGDVRQRDTLTEMEKGMISKIIMDIIMLQKKCWSARGVEFTPKLDMDEIDPTLVHPVAGAETATIVSFDVIKERARIEDALSMAYPASLLKSLAAVGVRRKKIQQAVLEPPKEWKEALQKELRQTVPITVRAILGNTELTIRELLELEVGDVILLHQSINAPIEIRVGDKVKFYGIPGVSGGKKAIKIVKVVPKEEEFIELKF